MVTNTFLLDAQARPPGRPVSRDSIWAWIPIAFYTYVSAFLPTLSTHPDPCPPPPNRSHNHYHRAATDRIESPRVPTTNPPNPTPKLTFAMCEFKRNCIYSIYILVIPPRNHKLEFWLDIYFQWRWKAISHSMKTKIELIVDSSIIMIFN